MKVNYYVLKARGAGNIDWNDVLNMADEKSLHDGEIFLVTGIVISLFYIYN